MSTKEIICQYLSKELLPFFEGISDQAFEQLKEIRLRSNLPLIVVSDKEEFGLEPQGFTEVRKSVVPSMNTLSDCLQLMSNYSLYAFEDELSKGYLTLPGGHRVGIVGRCVLAAGSVKTMKQISALNIRLSHEIQGVAEKLLGKILPPVEHTLIISPPACGKTTLLRDLIRLISDGTEGAYDLSFEGQAVGVVDERSEIAGSYMGQAQNYLGIRTDVLDACPKAEGMLMLLRSMSPKVIAVDEIGSQKDVAAIENIINGGVKVLATVHARNLEEVKQMPILSPLLKTFQHFIVLKGKGELEGIYGRREVVP